MGTYKGIQGYSVQKLASDPTVTDTIGQVFYNSGDNDFKFSQQGTGAYSAGGLLSSPTGEVQAGATHAGTQTAMLAMGGQVPPNAPKKTVESYDGTSWTAANDMVIERRSATSAGTTAAAWIGGGVNTPGHGINSAEVFDGTSWAAGNAMNTYRQTAAGFGNGSTTGIVGGPATESFDGTNWTTVNSMNSPRAQSAAGGPVTAGIAAGGAPGTQALTENYDGTSWSVTNTLNTGRAGPGGMGGYTDLVVSGGSNGPHSVHYDNTETWDGTSFSVASTLTLGRNPMQGCGGPSTAGLVFGGQKSLVGSNEFTNQTEEWNSPSYVTKTITSS